MKLLIAVLATALLASTSFAGTSSGPDLTGTWTGKGSCSGLAFGAKFKSKVNVTLDITSDTSLNKLASHTEYDGTGDVPFGLLLDGCGLVVTLEDKPGEGRGALHGFDSAALFSKFFTTDLTSFSVFPPDKKGRSGKIKATTTVADTSVEFVGSCKFKLDRTSTTDPGLTQCDESFTCTE